MNVQKVDIILLAGGKGTRFREVTQDRISKSLYRLNEIELMKYSLYNLDFSLVNSLIFALGHHEEGVKAWIEQQSFPCDVRFSYQQEPGVLGAVKSALSLVSAPSYIVCNTDEIREGLSLRDLLEVHNDAISSSVLATMAVTQTNNLHHHRSLTIDNTGIVLETRLKDPYYKEHRDIVGYANVGFIAFKVGADAYFDNAYGNDWSAMINPLVEAKLLQASINPNIQYFNVGTLSELQEANDYMMSRHFKPGLTPVLSR